MQEKMRKELSMLFSSAKDKAELEILIQGLLTPQEIEEITFRLRLLNRLLKKQTQREISRDLGVSLGKIARGSRLLKYDLPRLGEFLERYEKTKKDRAE